MYMMVWQYRKNRYISKDNFNHFFMSSKWPISSIFKMIFQVDSHVASMFEVQKRNWLC